MGILIVLMASATASAAVFGEDNATMSNESNMTMPDNVTGNQTGMMEANQTGNLTVVEIIGEEQNLTILSTAINATNLTETLSTGGPYTIFAPTDAAFEALGNDTINQLLNNTNQLTVILQYHVVEGNYTSQQLMEMVQQNMTAENQTMGNVTGNVTQNQTMGNVTGNVTQNQTMGNATGNVTQNQTANITGNVTGNETMLQTLLGENLTVTLNQTTNELMVGNASITMTESLEATVSSTSSMRC